MSGAKPIDFKPPQFVRSPRLVPVLLFLVAFTAVVAFSNRDRLTGTARGSDDHAVPAAKVIAPITPNRHEEAQGAPVPTVKEESGPATPVAPPHSEPTAEQLQAIMELRQQLAAPTEDGAPMEEREQRGDAIREAARVPGPRATQALIAALRNDSDRRNRIIAVEGLRKAAAEGDPDGSIREALREASTSPDEVIAGLAREASDALLLAK